MRVTCGTRVRMLLTVGIVSFLFGCGRTNHKMQQIQNGVENVDKYAKEIEKESQPPAK